MLYKLPLLLFFLLASLLPVVAQNPTTLNIPADTTYTPQKVWKQIRKDYPMASIAADELPAGVKEDRNAVYTMLKDTPYGDRALHADVFYPDAGGKRPVILLIHGGGWRSGNKSMQVPLAQRLAARGFVAICVEYQLSLEAKYPAAIHNIKAAVRWAKANSKKYGIDTTQVAISGSSAGGHLAALVGMTNGVSAMEGKQGVTDYSSDVQAVIDIDGVLDFLAPMSLNLERKSDSPDVEWLGGTYIEKPATWKEASPIFWVNESSVPILFINSGYPRFHAGQDEMISMLNRLGVYTEVKGFDVQVHPFWLFDPWIEPTANYMAGFLQKVFNTPKQKPSYPYNLTVAQDGSGDYTTIQEAVNSTRDLGHKRVTIHIKSGTYHEKLVIPSWKTNLTLTGESPESTIITGNDFSGEIIPAGADAVGQKKYSTYTSHTVLVQGNDIALENLTIENTAGRVGQAVALHVEGDRVAVRNCRLLGNQDTLYTATENSRQFYQDCYIEGTVDFIFGEATAVFQNCTVKSLADAYITAASTRPDQAFGYVFIDCTLIAAPAVEKVYLGRPWRPYAKTVFIRTSMDRHILPQGWDPWKGDDMFPGKEKTTLYAEYASKGPGANPKARINWAKQLNAKEAEAYTLNNIFGNWNPMAVH